jgi:phage shock protein PspC (stress-responsive transcriptional regulator)
MTDDRPPHPASGPADTTASAAGAAGPGDPGPASSGPGMAGPTIGAEPPPLTAFAWRSGLVRPVQGRVLAGVSGAFARATNTDPVLWRVVLAVLTIFGGIGALIYLIGWLALPADGHRVAHQALAGRGHRGPDRSNHHRFDHRGDRAGASEPFGPHRSSRFCCSAPCCCSCCGTSRGAGPGQPGPAPDSQRRSPRRRRTRRLRPTPRRPAHLRHPRGRRPYHRRRSRRTDRSSRRRLRHPRLRPPSPVRQSLLNPAPGWVCSPSR